MLWFKRIVVGFLSLILIISLFGLAASTDFDSAFSSPNHLKTWAISSNFYDSLLSKATSDTTKGLGSSSLSSQLDPVVKQSLQSVLSRSEFNSYISTVIDSNYAWLKGQTSMPNFSIDLSQQKTGFANKLGDYAATRYQSLPGCTLQEAESLQGANPLDTTCQIPSVSGAQIKSEIVNQIESTTVVVKNTVITASNARRHNGHPYYTAFNAPAVYKHVKVAPIGFAVIALICAVGIFFISTRKRRAIASLSFCFALPGIILTLSSIGSDKLDARINTHIAKSTGINSYITPTETLAHDIVHYVNGINLWFGIGYLVVSLALMSMLLLKHRRKNRQVPKDNNEAQEQPDTKPKEGLELKEENLDINSPTNSHKAKVQPTAPVVKPKTSDNKKRLIQ